MTTLEGLWQIEKSCREVATILRLVADKITYTLVPRKWAADKMVVVVNFTDELSIDIAVDEIGFVKTEVALDKLVRVRTMDSVYDMAEYYTEYLLPRSKSLQEIQNARRSESE